MVQLYLNGKSAQEIMEEYDLSPSFIHTWVKQFNKTESFKAQDNTTPEQIEYLRKDKRIKELEYEIIVSDLTYVRTGNHICTIMGLHNR